MGDEFDEAIELPDPFTYIANEREYSSTKYCTKGCGQSFTETSTTSQSAADMLASREANKHMREDH